MSSLKAVQDIVTEKYTQFIQKKQENETFKNLRKETILQEAKCFNQAQIDVKKCRLLISQLVYLINQGEKFTEKESSNLFFQITKLFNSENEILRRLLYLIIRELKNESSIFIITSSILKDVNSKNELFRVNSIRAVPIIVDPSNMVQIERYLKNSIVDKSWSVAVAAILASLQMVTLYPDLVKKWVNEVNSLLNSRQNETQYHALQLLHEIKKQDKNSFGKILSMLTKDQSSLTPLAAIQLIRFVKEMLIKNDEDKNLIDFLEKQSHRPSDLVAIEACKALCELSFLTNKDLQSVISVLQINLLSTSSVNKFASLKIINRLINNPGRQSLLSNTSEIETILNDNNKSLCCLAISLLLKICKINQIDDLLKKVQENLGLVSDEFKIEILKSVKALIKKVPQKYRSILGFLSDSLKSEGSQDFKLGIVDTIDTCIQIIPDCADHALLTLLEFIEDCQHLQVHLNILQLVSEYVYKLKINPQKYIYNRINLESEEIRAACINTLGKFALQFNQLKKQIKIILQMTLNDPDDETRERAFYFLKIIDEENQQQEIDLLNSDLDIQEITDIENYILQNIKQIKSSSDSSKLSIKNIKFQTKSEVNYDNNDDDDDMINQQDQKEQEPEIQQNNYEQYSAYGTVLAVSNKIDLTEKNAEYYINLVKVHFEEFILLDFNVTNNEETTAIEDIQIQINLSSENLKIVEENKIQRIDSQKTEKCQIIVAKNPEIPIIVSQANCLLKFTVVDVNNSYEDEYQLEDFEFTLSEYLIPQQVYLVNQDSWNQLKFECSQSYQLSYKTVQLANQGLLKHFGLQQSKEKQEQNQYQQLYLSGSWFGLHKVLVKATIGYDQKYGCVVKLQVKSSDESIALALSESIQ